MHYFKFRIFGNIKPYIMQVNNILTTLIKIPDKLFLLVTIETLLEILAFFCHSSFSRPSCQENPLKANPFRSTGSNNTKKKTSFFSFRLDSNSYSLVIVPCPVSSCTWRPIYVNIIIFAPSIKANFLHLCNTKPSFIIWITSLQLTKLTEGKERLQITINRDPQLPKLEEIRMFLRRHWSIED